MWMFASNSMCNKCECYKCEMMQTQMSMVYHHDLVCLTSLDVYIVKTSMRFTLHSSMYQSFYRYFYNFEYFNFYSSEQCVTCFINIAKNMVAHFMSKCFLECFPYLIHNLGKCVFMYLGPYITIGLLHLLKKTHTTLKIMWFITKTFTSKSRNKILKWHISWNLGNLC